MMLNAGCGAHYVDGWVNLDVDEDCRADFHADVTDIPLPDGSVKWIFASHLLEHLEYGKQVPAALAEFARLLTPGGALFVLGPDIERAVLLGEPGAVLKAIVAWPEEFNTGRWAVKTPPAGHAWTATGPLVEQALTAAGFMFTAYSGRLREAARLGWPVGNLSAWQNAYLCTLAGME